MKQLTFLLVLAGLLAACESGTPPFHQMTEAELVAYNDGRPLEQKVFCTKEADTSTYIRKTKCQTIRQYINHNQAAAMQMDVMDFGKNFNEGIGRQRD